MSLWPSHRPKNEDEAVRRWKVESLHQVSTHIMGRVTYEQMAGYWPYNGPADNRQARVADNVSTIVGVANGADGAYWVGLGALVAVQAAMIAIVLVVVHPKNGRRQPTS
jgi:dihydrofolate reductase